jgi:hypothetical protein
VYTVRSDGMCILNARVKIISVRKVKNGFMSCFS